MSADRPMRDATAPLAPMPLTTVYRVLGYILYVTFYNRMNVTYIYDLTSGICIDSITNHIESNTISSDLMSKKALIRCDVVKDNLKNNINPYDEILNSSMLSSHIKVKHTSDEKDVTYQRKLDKWHSKDQYVPHNGNKIYYEDLNEEDQTSNPIEKACIGCGCETDDTTSTYGGVITHTCQRVVDTMIKGINHKQTITFPVYAIGRFCQDCYSMMRSKIEVIHQITEHRDPDEDAKPIRANKSGKWRKWDRI